VEAARNRVETEFAIDGIVLRQKSLYESMILARDQ